MPRTTVQGVRKTDVRRTGTCRLDGADAVGYLRISEITASTPHELRKLARSSKTKGTAPSCSTCGAEVGGTAVHPTVLLADSLLDHGTIGRVRTVEREMTYEADSDALFRGWPMAVLVDGSQAEPRSGSRPHFKTIIGPSSWAAQPRGAARDDPVGRREITSCPSATARGRSTW